MSKAGVFGWTSLVTVALLGLAGSGLAGLLILSGVFVLLVGVVALLFGRVRWARLGSRVAGAVAIGAAMLLLGVGGAVAGDPTTPSGHPDDDATSPDGRTSSAPTSPTPAAPSPSPSATSTGAAAGTALAAVAQLRVGGRGPMTGYSREAFGQTWFDTDRNGCDTRNDVLRRDLTARTMKNSCKVLAGTLAPDPYTGERVRFVYGGGSEVDVDHVVSLGDAWQKGAAQWAAGKRLAFANDPLNLLSVDPSTNRSKGDGDTATWLPPRKDFRCAYVARQVAVKKKYAIRVTSAERDAMVRVLSACPSQALPAPGSAPTVAALPRQRTPASARPRALVARPAAPLVVHPGSFCSPEGALGVTNRGTAMRCTFKPGDTRARWRSR